MLKFPTVQWQNILHHSKKKFSLILGFNLPNFTTVGGSQLKNLTAKVGILVYIYIFGSLIPNNADLLIG